MERETGIEPATNSLEGCDSTTELLPLDFFQERVYRKGVSRLTDRRGRTAADTFRRRATRPGPAGTGPPGDTRVRAKLPAG